MVGKSHFTTLQDNLYKITKLSLIFLLGKVMYYPIKKVTNYVTYCEEQCVTKLMHNFFLAGFGSFCFFQTNIIIIFYKCKGLLAALIENATQIFCLTLKIMCYFTYYLEKK